MQKMKTQLLKVGDIKINTTSIFRKSESYVVSLLN